MIVRHCSNAALAVCCSTVSTYRTVNTMVPPPGNCALWCESHASSLKASVQRVSLSHASCPCDACACVVLSLQSTVDMKESIIANYNCEVSTLRAVAADLEEQLRHAGNAGVVRQLQRQLHQTVLVHRQLLRKVKMQ